MIIPKFTWGFGIGVIFAFCLGVQAEINLTPTEIEAETSIGQTTTAAFLQTQVRLDAPELQQLCQDIVNRLLQAAGTSRECRVHLVNAPIISALVFPTGDIVLYAGLLEEMERPDDIAVVLGHEVSHFLNHDMFRNTQKIISREKSGIATAYFLTTVIVSAAGSAAATAVDSRSNAGNFGEGFGLGVAIGVASEIAARSAVVLSAPLVKSVVAAVTRDYGANVEKRADNEGLALAKKAGFDDLAGAAFLEKLLQQYAEAAAARKANAK